MNEETSKLMGQAHAAATIALYNMLKKAGWTEQQLVKLVELFGSHRDLMMNAAALLETTKDAPTVPAPGGVSA